MSNRTNPDTQLHAFRTFLGMPPDVDTPPVCGARISREYGVHIRPTERCAACDRIVRLLDPRPRLGRVRDHRRPARIGRPAGTKTI